MSICLIFGKTILSRRRSFYEYYIIVSRVRTMQTQVTSSMQRILSYFVRYLRLFLCTNFLVRPVLLSFFVLRRSFTELEFAACVESVRLARGPIDN